MSRDIDAIIARVHARHPDAVIAQLKVVHPGVDDDGVWTVRLPAQTESIQVESSTGNAPFLVESDGVSPTRNVATLASVDEAVLAITAFLSRTNQK
jgi:hypothetical protein